MTPLSLDALAKVIEFVHLVQTQTDGGYKPDRHATLVGGVGDVDRLAEAESWLAAQHDYFSRRAADADVARALDDALVRLSAADRELLELHVFQKMGVRRLSKHLGSPGKTTLHRRLRRALDELRAELEGDARLVGRLK